jgi:uncharacterized protein YlaI
MWIIPHVCSYDALMRLGMRVTGVCTDNAANMLKGVREAARERPIIGVPCFAHSAQLFVKDSFDQRERWTAVSARCKDIRVDVVRQRVKPSLRLPEANDTRWNSTYRLVKAVVAAQDAQKLEAANELCPADLRTANEMIKSLGPVKTFTDIVQADSATLLDALCAFDLLFELQKGNNARFFAEIMEDRCHTFVCEATTVICAMSPSFSFADVVGAPRADLLGHLTNIVTSDHIRNLLSPQLRVSLEAEVKALPERHAELWPATCIEKGVSTKSFRKALASTAMQAAMPALAELTRVLCSVLATEASCERVFSIVKKIVNSQRTKLLPENVMSCLQVNYLLRDLQTLEPDAATREVLPNDADDDAIDVDEKRDVVLTNRVTKLFVEAAISEYQRIAAEEENDKCECGVAFARQQKPKIQCRVCNRSWHILECAKKFNQLRDEPVNNGQWMCTSCKKKEIGLDSSSSSEEENADT